MGSIEAAPITGTLTFPIDEPLPEYDPWASPYGKAPPGIMENATSRTLSLRDFRDEVLNDNYSIPNARKFLSQHGFTVVKHSTALHSPPYGMTEHFLDADLVDTIYYEEVKQLVKDATGCSAVFITDSLMRMGGIDRDSEENLRKNWQWEKKSAPNPASSNGENAPVRIHKTSPTPPTRVPHWDYNPLGARQTIRNWSEDITAYANKLGIIKREDELCGATSATDTESNAILDEKYDGPRYACFTVWRPLKTITRDPLAMAPSSSIEANPGTKAVTHRIKQPGIRGDWLRELATLKVKPNADEKASAEAGRNLDWRYVSNQKIDEVLIVKAFDSAALPGQAKETGEAAAAVHASPDLGDAGYGGPRESVEVRLVAFW